MRQYLDDILHDRYFLRLQYFGSKLYDARVIDDQEADVGHLMIVDQAELYTGERVVYRYWSGRVVGQTN